MDLDKGTVHEKSVVYGRVTAISLPEGVSFPCVHMCVYPVVQVNVSVYGNSALLFTVKSCQWDLRPVDENVNWSIEQRLCVCHLSLSY